LIVHVDGKQWFARHGSELAINNIHLNLTGELVSNFRAP
jgi:hypothetical protein